MINEFVIKIRSTVFSKFFEELYSDKMSDFGDMKNIRGKKNLPLPYPPMKGIDTQAKIGGRPGVVGASLDLSKVSPSNG